ncbi:LPS assembly lipoprotein LptE [Microbulbifer sp. OS29]|uniref:LPS-assembly lipoprotein LptE n=1 Tax=Microbulbifer okhotskensis TaxID=2926617 RepID=A0A9X2EQH3_9GAMM|nr:LPS assembly lipoprotein LptE [Microbulbifer okhotskensis]MCO1333863.1 LPS assembly lipoprotein LptE [Microbulbifer okhotskensis]
MRTITSRAFIFLLAIAVASCGWHLRGAPKNFPPGSTLYISSENPRSDIADQMTRLLNTAGVPIAESPMSADYVLIIHQEIERKLTVAVDSEGRASEYELITGAIYSVRTGTGEVLLNKAQADVYRTLEWDISEIVSKSEEENTLRAEMRRELIGRIIDRLRRIDVNAPLEDKSY